MGVQVIDDDAGRAHAIDLRIDFVIDLGEAFSWLRIQRPKKSVERDRNAPLAVGERRQRVRIRDRLAADERQVHADSERGRIGKQRARRVEIAAVAQHRRAGDDSGAVLAFTIPREISGVIPKSSALTTRRTRASVTVGTPCLQKDRQKPVTAVASGGESRPFTMLRRANP